MSIVLRRDVLAKLPPLHCPEKVWSGPLKEVDTSVSQKIPKNTNIFKNTQKSIYFILVETFLYFLTKFEKLEPL